MKIVSSGVRFRDIVIEDNRIRHTFGNYFFTAERNVSRIKRFLLLGCFSIEEKEEE